MLLQVFSIIMCLVSFQHIFRSNSIHTHGRAHAVTLQVCMSTCTCIIIEVFTCTCSMHMINYKGIEMHILCRKELHGGERSWLCSGTWIVAVSRYSEQYFKCPGGIFVHVHVHCMYMCLQVCAVYHFTHTLTCITFYMKCRYDAHSFSG